MLLIGMLGSPFVRRVAVSMRLLGLDFEHANWSIGKDLERIRQYNPLGRVPTLVLDEGEVLIESSAVLDYLDEIAGPRHALLPASGRERREALRLISLALGAAEKARDVVYENRFRPPERRDEDWMARCRMQLHGALQSVAEHGQKRSGRWLVGDKLSQADVTVTCAFTFITHALQMEESAASQYPSLATAVNRCEAMAEFVSTFSAPSMPSSSGLASTGPRVG